MNVSAKQDRDIDVENKLMDTNGSGGEWDKMGDWDICILL